MEANGKEITEKTEVYELLSVQKVQSEIREKLGKIEEILESQNDILNHAINGGLSKENYLQDGIPVLYNKVQSAMKSNENARDDIKSLKKQIIKRTQQQRLSQLTELQRIVKQLWDVLVAATSNCERKASEDPLLEHDAAYFFYQRYPNSKGIDVARQELQKYETKLKEIHQAITLLQSDM